VQARRPPHVVEVFENLEDATGGFYDAAGHASRPTMDHGSEPAKKPGRYSHM
jgi:hypothetical protein